MFKRAAALTVLVLAGTAPAAGAVTVDATTSLGITDGRSETRELAGALSGRGLGNGGLSLRVRDDKGSFAFYDGDGSVTGKVTLRSSTAEDGTVTYDGTFTASSGTGRYRGASGRLPATGRLDTQSVPGVAVVRLRLRGTLDTNPARARQRAVERLRVRLNSEEAKSDLEAPTLIVSATARNAVIVSRRRIQAGDEIPETFVYYDARGTFSGKGTLRRSNGQIDGDFELTVTRGTGRYRGLKGKLVYTAFVPGASGYSQARYRGTLRR